MATSAVNNVVKPGKTLEYVRSTSVSYNQGDLIYSNSGVATPATTADTHTQYAVGVALNSNPITPSPYGTAVYPDVAEIGYGGVYEFKTTVGESYTHDTAVNVGADSQTVTTTAGTYPVGKVYRPDGSTLTGAAGAKVLVRIFNRTVTGSVLA